MKKTLLIISLLFLVSLVNVAHAENVGIVVEFSDGNIKTDCVNVPSGTDGFEILQKSVFDILWSPKHVILGSSLCKIKGEGNDLEGGSCFNPLTFEFWNFNILSDGDSAWLHSPVGHNGVGGCWNRDVFSFAGRYCGIDRDVIGYKFGLFPAEPPLKTYEQICEKLKVKDVKVYVDGKKETGADEDGGKIDVVPGSKLELKIELENLYTDDEDLEIRDITIEGILEDIDDGNDIEDDIDDFDINADKDKKITLKFDIPLEVDEDEYDLVIEIEGENERGFLYFQKIEFEVEVDKEKHDVVFSKLEFLDNSVECGKSATLKVDIVNLGTNDEEVKFAISNPELGINIGESFKLSQDPFDKDNSFSKSYKIELPTGINPGTYIILGDLFFEDGVESSIVELNILCSNALELKSEEVGLDAQTEPTQTNQPLTSVSGVVISVSPEVTGLSNKNILISLFAGEVIFLIAGIALLVFLLRK